jgi:hypothetical protein
MDLGGRLSPRWAQERAAGAQAGTHVQLGPAPPPERRAAAHPCRPSTAGSPLAPAAHLLCSQAHPLADQPPPRPDCLHQPPQLIVHLRGEHRRRRRRGRRGRRAAELRGEEAQAGAGGAAGAEGRGNRLPLAVAAVLLHELPVHGEEGRAEQTVGVGGGGVWKLGGLHPCKCDNCHGLRAGAQGAGTGGIRTVGRRHAPCGR